MVISCLVGTQSPGLMAGLQFRYRIIGEISNFRHCEERPLWTARNPLTEVSSMMKGNLSEHGFCPDDLHLQELKILVVHILKHIILLKAHILLE